MSPDKITLFTPYPFTVGQKIRITAGHRAGDWLVVAVSEKKVTLRCPVSRREFEWDRFCYQSGESDGPWPLHG